MIRRRAFDRAGPFDELLAGRFDDIEWMMRLRASGGQIVYTPNSWILHRRTPEMIRLKSRLRKAFVGGRQEVRFLERGRPPRPKWT